MYYVEHVLLVMSLFFFRAECSEVAQANNLKLYKMSVKENFNIDSGKWVVVGSLKLKIEVFQKKSALTSCSSKA